MAVHDWLLVLVTCLGLGQIGLQIKQGNRITALETLVRVLTNEIEVLRGIK